MLNRIGQHTRRGHLGQLHNHTLFALGVASASRCGSRCLGGARGGGVGVGVVWVAMHDDGVA